VSSDEMRRAVELAHQALVDDAVNMTSTARYLTRAHAAKMRHREHVLADAVIALSARLEQADLELSAHRSMAMIEPKEMSYQDRSEFTRLKHADVAQGKRVAELLGRLEQVQKVVEAAREFYSVRAGMHTNGSQHTREMRDTRERLEEAFKAMEES